MDYAHRYMKKARIRLILYFLFSRQGDLEVPVEMMIQVRVPDCLITPSYYLSIYPSVFCFLLLTLFHHHIMILYDRRSHPLLVVFGTQRAVHDLRFFLVEGCRRCVALFPNQSIAQEAPKTAAVVTAEKWESANRVYI